MYKCIYIGDEIFSTAISSAGVETVPAKNASEAETTCLRLLKRSESENYGLIMVESHLWDAFPKEVRARFVASIIPVLVPVKGVST